MKKVDLTYSSTIVLVAFGEGVEQYWDIGPCFVKV